MASGGLGEGLWQVAQNSLIQRRTPDAVRSRVLAGSEAAMQGGIAIGLLVSGFTIGTLGPSGAFAVAAGAAGSATTLLIAFGLRTAAIHDVTPPNSRLAEARDGTPRQIPDGAPLSPSSGRRPVSPTPAGVTSAP
jgi:MFS family permease